MRLTGGILLVIIASAFTLRCQTSFYEPASLQKIEIWFAQPGWDHLLDTAKAGKGGFIMAAWMRVNGTRLDSVGVKYKGNSSYDSTFAKNPLHIELNTYRDQDYQGFTDIKLSNGYADPSMIREVLSYEILGNYMRCPRSNFAQLYINGQYMGLYASSESVNKDFCAQNFFTRDGVFVKGNPLLTPSSNVKSNLRYLGADTTLYYNYYELKSDGGWAKLRDLCDTLTNKPASASTMINADRFLWMLAFNMLFVNLDSYTGVFAQNHYLYRDATGRFNPIVWDLNMSFGGFPFLGSSNTSLASLSIQSMQNLPVNVHSTDQYWPLIKAVYADPLLKKMYLAHLKTMTTEQISSGSYITRYNFFRSLIDTAVLSDNKKFYSYSQFQNALNTNVSVGSYSVPGIQTLMAARESYLKSTVEFQSVAPVINTLAIAPVALNKAATITCSVNGAGSVYLGYRTSASQNFTRVAMYDDGLHNDGAAGDMVYGVSITVSGNNTQYYFYAENSAAGMFSPERAEHEFYSLDIYRNPVKGEIVINEFLADNESDVKNEYHVNSDWIELFNNSNSPLSLSGFYLSDNENEKAFYAFPYGTVIQAKSYLTVWADEFATGSGLHSGFKLNESSDRIIFSNGLRDVHDAITFTSQQTDISMARCPDGTGQFVYNSSPSFGLSNCIVGLNENGTTGSFGIFPNPASDRFTVVNESNGNAMLKVCDITGRCLLSTSCENNTSIDCSSLSAGVYIITVNDKSSKLIIKR